MKKKVMAALATIGAIILILGVTALGVYEQCRSEYYDLNCFYITENSGPKIWYRSFKGLYQLTNVINKNGEGQYEDNDEIPKAFIMCDRYNKTGTYVYSDDATGMTITGTLIFNNYDSCDYMKYELDKSTLGVYMVAQEQLYHFPEFNCKYIGSKGSIVYRVTKHKLFGHNDSCIEVLSDDNMYIYTKISDSTSFSSIRDIVGTINSYVYKPHIEFA